MARRKALSPKALKAYPRDMELSIAARAAHCLDWCAERYPHVWVPWNWLWQALVGGPRTPRMDNDHVVSLRKRTSAIRKILMNVYNRPGMPTSVPQEAVRACVDSNDAYESGEMDRVSKRVASSANTLLTHYELIKPTTLTTDNRARHDELGPATAKLSSPALQRRLLPPPSEDGESE